jgi:hypothetical protein
VCLLPQSSTYPQLSPLKFTLGTCKPLMNLCALQMTIHHYAGMVKLSQRKLNSSVFLPGSCLMSDINRLFPSSGACHCLPSLARYYSEDNLKLRPIPSVCLICIMNADGCVLRRKFSPSLICILRFFFRWNCIIQIFTPRLLSSWQHGNKEYTTNCIGVVVTVFIRFL